jgi:hypothetical protein
VERTRKNWARTVLKLFQFVSNREINTEEAHAERQERLKQREIEKRIKRASDILTRTEPETAIKLTKLTYDGDDAEGEGIVRETPGSVTRTLGQSGEEEWILFLRGEPHRSVTREELMDLKMYRLHLAAEHLNEKERKDSQRRNIRMSVRERMHYENVVKDTLRDEWEHDMLAEHAKMKLGVYDKFEDFLELARAIKKPYTRKYTYESSQSNRLETVEVTYDSNEFRCIPESVVNAAKKIILGLDEKNGKSKRVRDGDEGTTANQPPKKKRTLNGMFVAKRGGNMFECLQQLSKDEVERDFNAGETRKKALTKRYNHLSDSFTRFMEYKQKCVSYNLARETSDSTGTDRRNYWSVSDIPNQTIRKLFLSTFGPEKSGMLGKKSDLQIAYLNDREKMGMSFTQVQVDAYLDKMERDLEDAEQELGRLEDAQPMEETEADLARASDTIETSDDIPAELDTSRSIEQEPLLNVIAEDGRPIELLIERSSEIPDVEGEAEFTDERGTFDDDAAL